MNFKDRYLSLEEAQEFTGIPAETLRKKTDPKRTPKEDLLPSYKPGREIRVKLSELERWMQSFRAS